MAKRSKSKKTKLPPAAEPAMSPQPQTVLPREAWQVKLSHLADSNLFWSGGIALAVAAYGFILAGALIASVMLLALAWLTITVAFYRYNFFEGKSKAKQVAGHVFISGVLAVILVGGWFSLRPKPLTRSAVTTSNSLALVSKARVNAEALAKETNATPVQVASLLDNINEAYTTFQKESSRFSSADELEKGLRTSLYFTRAADSLTQTQSSPISVHNRLEIVATRLRLVEIEMSKATLQETTICGESDRIIDTNEALKQSTDQKVSEGAEDTVISAKRIKAMTGCN
jgi:hypothetical protein